MESRVLGNHQLDGFLANRSISRSLHLAAARLLAMPSSCPLKQKENDGRVRKAPKTAGRHERK